MRLNSIPSTASRLITLGLSACVALACDSDNLPPNFGPQITLAPPSATLAVGDSARFEATVALREKGVSWASTMGGIASVDSLGVVRGIAPGLTTITATARGEMYVNAAAIVTVRLP
jgi:uncharacterized protein YjdB